MIAPKVTFSLNFYPCNSYPTHFLDILHFRVIIRNIVFGFSKFHETKTLYLFKSNFYALLQTDLTTLLYFWQTNKSTLTMQQLTLLITLIFTFFITNLSNAQISTIKPDRACINCPTNEPSASAVLEIQATNKGVLIPRVANTAAILNPTIGLLIFDNSDSNFKYYNGSNWVEFGGSSESAEFGISNDAGIILSTALGHYNDAGTEGTAVGNNNDANGVSGTAVGSENETGSYGTAIGFMNEATGSNSIAQGYINVASGINSTAIGFNNFATNNSAIAIGVQDTVGSGNGIAIGIRNATTGIAATSVGFTNIAAASQSTAIGFDNAADSLKTSAVGHTNYANNTNASAFGYDNIASGVSSSAFGFDNTVANMSDSSSAFGYRNNVTGSINSAFGARNQAAGTATTALGYNNEADGESSIAVGYNNTAVNTKNTAVGISNTSTGFENSAFGYSNNADGLFYSTALGHSNTSFGSGSTAVGYANSASADGSNAFGELNVVDNELGSSGGNAFGSYNLVDGVNSLAYGRENNVSSDFGSTFGHLNIVTSDSSSALGYKNQTLGISNTAVGYLNETSGSWSSAVGAENQATVVGSSAFGYSNEASGSESSAFGYRTSATSSGSSAFGKFSNATAFNSVAVGNGASASGDFSSAFGLSTRAPLFRMTAIGTYNEIPLGSSSSWIATEPVFIVGNGENSSNRSTALTILKNGNTGIGTMTPTDAQFIVESAEYDDNIGENIAIFSKSNSNSGITHAHIKLLANGHAGIKFIDQGNGGIGESDYMIKMSSAGDLDILNADNADDEFVTNTRIARFETTSDLYQFTVYGDALASSGTWINSDRRLKKNIKNLDNPLEKIMQLQPKYYDFDYKNPEFDYLNLSEKTQIGLIAQELEKVFPELVKTDRLTPNTDKNEIIEENTIKEVKDLKAVNYTALIPVLIGAVQEQQNTIENKDKRIENLEIRLAKIEAQLARLSTLETTKIQLENNNTPNHLPQLQQNQPNPFSDYTTIQYFIPKSVQRAQLQFHDLNGKTLKIIEIAEKGNGQIELETAALISGIYSYSLVLDGKIFETKRMVVTK